MKTSRSQTSCWSKDPWEENNIVGTAAWVIGPYLKLVGEYQKSLEKYPNPKPVNLTEFGK